jgi:hypothetical protein
VSSRHFGEFALLGRPQDDGREAPPRLSPAGLHSESARITGSRQGFPKTARCGAHRLSRRPQLPERREGGDGRLSAVIDFGCSAVGDPACDLAIAWTFLDDAARHAFRAALPLDSATWARGRAWTLWKALVVLAGLPNVNLHDRQQSRKDLDRLLADCPAQGGHESFVS